MLFVIVVLFSVLELLISFYSFANGYLVFSKHLIIPTLFSVVGKCNPEHFFNVTFLFGYLYFFFFSRSSIIEVVGIIVTF